MHVFTGLVGPLGALGFDVVVRSFGRFLGVLRSIFAHIVLLCAGVVRDLALSVRCLPEVLRRSFGGELDGMPPAS